MGHALAFFLAEAATLKKVACPPIPLHAIYHPAKRNVLGRCRMTADVGLACALDGAMCGWTVLL
eukprot:1159344-Pelagomonas_calceolata.AAC.21